MISLLTNHSRLVLSMQITMPHALKSRTVHVAKDNSILGDGVKSLTLRRVGAGGFVELCCVTHAV